MKGLTEKQRDILKLHDLGWPVQAIANELRLTEGSINAQLKRIAKKAKAGMIQLPPLPIEALSRKAL